MQTQNVDSAVPRDFQSELTFDDRVQDGRAFIRRSHSLARAAWNGAVALEGSLGEQYLSACGLRCSTGLRFHAGLWLHSRQRLYPALVGQLVSRGVDDDSFVAAAVVAVLFDPDTLERVEQIVFGNPRGRGLILGPPAPNMAVAANIECALAASKLLGVSAVAASQPQYLDQTTVPRRVQTLTVALDRALTISAARSAARLEMSVRRVAGHDVVFHFAPPPAPFETWRAAARAGGVGMAT